MILRRLTAIAFLCLWTAVAGAQAKLRTIPDDAQRGSLSHVAEMTVEIDGTRRQIAPGGQIRDQSNRVILPSAVAPGSLVKYRLDGDGMVQQVWILTPEEAAQRDRR
jgi:type II secretory pathway component PulM